MKAHLLVLFLLLAACGARRQPTYTPLIVVLGSSTAAGAGLADPSTSWVNRYATFLAKQRPASRVKNLAVSGFSSYELQPTGTHNPAGRPDVDAAHNVTAALALHPETIVINLPSNDAAMGVPVADSLANIGVIVAAARKANIQVWVTTSQPRDLPPDRFELLVAYRDRILQIYGPHALDFFTPLATPEGKPNTALNQGDGIHPNPEGHQRLFETVRAAKLQSAIH